MHSACGSTKEASSSALGDSIAQGEENSALKKTAPDSRTTRKTSDSMSMDLLRTNRKVHEGFGFLSKNFRASVNVSSKPGALSKRNGVPVMDAPEGTEGNSACETHPANQALIRGAPFWPAVNNGAGR